MIFDRAGDVAAALAPLGLPVRTPLDNRAVVGPCYLLQPPTATVTVTAGRCVAQALAVDVLVVGPNGENLERLLTDVDAAVQALAAAGLLAGDVEVSPGVYEAPDAANPVPAYTIPCTA